MNRTGKINFVFQNSVFYLCGMVILLGMKLYYRQADCESLLWILAPTARWVELLSRIPLTYLPGAGYVNHELRMVIAPSCSGVRFMIIAFAVLAFSFVPAFTSSAVVSVRKGRGLLPSRGKVRGFREQEPLGRIVRGAAWIAVSLFLSWAFTVFVNGLRIILAVFLPDYLEAAGLMGGILTQDRLHTMIGTVVYFVALLTIYRLTDMVLHRMLILRPGLQPDIGDRQVSCDGDAVKAFAYRCAAPVFWYFVLTLGIPLLNRSSRGDVSGQMEFTVTVLMCCLPVLLVYGIGTALYRQRQKK